MTECRIGRECVIKVAYSTKYFSVDYAVLDIYDESGNKVARLVDRDATLTSATFTWVPSRPGTYTGKLYVRTLDGRLFHDRDVTIEVSPYAKVVICPRAEGYPEPDVAVVGLGRKVWREGSDVVLTASFFTDKPLPFRQFAIKGGAVFKYTYYVGGSPQPAESVADVLVGGDLPSGAGAYAEVRLYGMEYGGRLDGVRFPIWVEVEYDVTTGEVVNYVVRKYTEIEGGPTWEPVAVPRLTSIRLVIYDSGTGEETDSAAVPLRRGSGKVLRAYLTFDRVLESPVKVTLRLVGLEVGEYWYRPFRVVECGAGSDEYVADLWDIGDLLADWVVANGSAIIPLIAGKSFVLSVIDEESGLVSNSVTVTVAKAEVKVVAELTVTGGTVPIDAVVYVAVGEDVRSCSKTAHSVPDTLKCEQTYLLPPGTHEVRAWAELSNAYGTTKVGPVSKSFTV